MSFVGPRPTLATRPYSEFPEEYKRRYGVRPGITGYTQAYYRNSIGQNEKFAKDCYYVDNYSFGMDIKILFQTVAAVLKQKNIYVEQEKEPVQK